MAYTNQQGGFGGMLSPQQIEEYTEIFLKYKKQLEEPLLKEERIYTTCVNPDCITNQQEAQPPIFMLNQVFTCVNHVIRLMAMLVVIMI